VVRVLALGVALMAACVVIDMLGTGQAYFWAALVALGLGWNFLYIGGTALLTKTYRPEEHSKSQGLNDLIVYAAIAAAALGTGAIDSMWGWRGINLAVVPALAIIAGAVAWLAARNRAAL
jgi:MFS family permease